MRVVSACLLGVVGAWSGCVESSAIVCDDGTLCPADKVCNVTGPGCVDPQGLVVPDGVITISSVPCGGTAAAEISIGNPSSAPIAFEARSTIDLVTLDPESGVVEAGGSLDLQVVADATADTLPVGKLEGAISITTEDQLIPRILDVTITGAVIRLSEQGIDFGIASLAALPNPRTFTIFNDGNAAIDVVLTPPDNPFSIDATDALRIEGGSSQDVAVTFAPMFTGTETGSITMSLAGAVCQPPPLTVALSGAIDDAPLLIDTLLLDYGTTACGVAEDTRSLVITSNLAQSQALAFELSGTDALAYLVPGSTVVAPGGQVTVDVNRAVISAPQFTGTKNAQLRVTASPSNEILDVDLTHEIQAPLIVAPTSVNFGLIPQSVLATEDINVSNNGTVPTTVTAMPQPQSLPGNGSLFTGPQTLALGAMSQKKWGVAVASGTQSFISAGLILTVDAPGQCNAPTNLLVDVAVQ